MLFQTAEVGQEPTLSSEQFWQGGPREDFVIVVFDGDYFDGYSKHIKQALWEIFAND
jgi:hypothetical protein